MLTPVRISYCTCIITLDNMKADVVKEDLNRPWWQVKVKLEPRVYAASSYEDLVQPFVSAKLTCG